MNSIYNLAKSSIKSLNHWSVKITWCSLNNDWINVDMVMFEMKSVEKWENSKERRECNVQVVWANTFRCCTFMIPEGFTAKSFPYLFVIALIYQGSINLDARMLYKGATSIWSEILRNESTSGFKSVLMCISNYEWRNKKCNTSLTIARLILHHVRTQLLHEIYCEQSNTYSMSRKKGQLNYTKTPPVYIGCSGPLNLDDSSNSSAEHNDFDFMCDATSNVGRQRLAKTFYSTGGFLFLAST